MTYQIISRAPDLGGGFQALIFDDDQEIAGGIFPLGAYTTSDNPTVEAFNEAIKWAEAEVALGGLTPRAGFQPE